MSWRSKGLPLAILAIFLIQISAPVFQFPIPILEEKDDTAALSVDFSTGSGHDLEGDVINVDGKNWTVRGESILDYWTQEVQNKSDVSSIDLVLTETGQDMLVLPMIQKSTFTHCTKMVVLTRW